MITRLRWRSRHDVGHGQHPRPHATTRRLGVVAHVAGDAAELLACLDQAHNESVGEISALPTCHETTRGPRRPTDSGHPTSQKRIGLRDSLEPDPR
jgi:hypothetical protein